MALECHGTGNSKDSPDHIDNNPWDEEVAPTQFGSSIPRAISGFVFRKERHESVLPEPSSEFHPKKGITSSGSQKLSPSNDSASNGLRNITDLPPALLSEILHCLDAKELGIVSCVSTFLYQLACNHYGWKELYCERWGLPLGSARPGSEFPDEKSWKKLFVEREYRSKTFMGRYSIDVLYGHTEAVRAVFLLTPAKLIFTGGYDSIIRMWDMEEGLSIASSRPLGCTIRAVAADTKLLVAGGTDGFLQCWKAVAGLPHLFDITGAQNHSSEFRLWEHKGPVTCLALDPMRIYSGSWDMTVLVWDRSLFKCVKILMHGDWVWSLVPRGSNIASTAGRDVYMWDIDSGDQLTMIENVHTGNTCALARSYMGDLLFTGGEDGAIHMFEIKSHSMVTNATKVATWIPHSGSVHSLTFEFPWLVSASSDGKLSLIDVRKLLKASKRSWSRNPSKVNRSAAVSVEAPQRMLHGFGCNLFSVDIGADRIVCGGEEGVVRMWNFSQALEIERRVRALRGIRLENRMRRRKIQTEMNTKGGRADQCSVAAKKNQINGDRSVWHAKRGVSGKLKA
ncbi:F-box/WD-40 repeat-containing protein At5g21040 [Macadamia integrifolia]|uniref:F-box/WD-40 repeat-containing protein At5g21040 n=1 Tax=Macadamia integrifolia TaxID=60698 RepID=UPI001C4FE8F6|nr:F-box/WD-40 repeat-containing protein At5g21040 [Macadamia integrifolia]